MSTADSLVDVIETVIEKLENQNKCAILSIDLCKAFDTLNHYIIFKKLYVYGIRGIYTYKKYFFRPFKELFVE